MSKEFKNIIVSLQEELNGVKLENRSLKDLFREQSYSVDRDGEGVKSETEEGFREQVSNYRNLSLNYCWAPNHCR